LTVADSTLAFNILARDHASSAFDKVARSADKTGAALQKTSKISDDVAKASANLTKAHNAESDSLDKVQLAEVKLADVRNNSKSKTSQIVAAENALAKARRDSAVASNVAQKAAKDLGSALDNEGKKAGKGLGASLKKWFSGDGKGVFKQIGEDGSSVFGSGFLGALKTPILGPAIVGVLGAAVAVAAPAVGAVAAGGIVAGFGAGLAGLGLVFAAKSKVVQETWKRTITGMGAQMRELSKPFESTLIAMSSVAQRTFDKFAPALGQAFKKMAPALTAFGDQLGRAFERLAPAVGPLSDAFGAVLRSLGPAMQSAIGNVSQGLVTLAESVRKNPDGLADLVDGLGQLTNKALGAISALNDFNGKISALTGGTSAVDLVFGRANSKIGEFAGFVKSAVDPLAGLKSGLDAVFGSSDKAAASVADLGAEATLSGGAAGDMGAKVAAFNATAKPAVKAAESLAATFDRQAAATQRANDALTRQSGLLLTLSGSQIAYEAALDDATASIKENGKTHDISTAKGRANKTALDQVAASAQAQTVAMRNAGDGNVSAAKHAEGARKNFIKLATQMGYTVPQAKAMAQSMIKIPNVTRTAKLQADKKDLDAKLAAAKRALDNPKLTATKRAKLEARYDQLKAAVNAAQAKINGLKGKTVVVRYSAAGVTTWSAASTRGGGKQGGIGMKAGGPVRGPGGPTDDRAGLFALSDNEHVWTAKEVAAAGGHAAIEDMRKAVLRRGGGRAAGGPANINLIKQGVFRSVKEGNAYLNKMFGGGPGGPPGSRRSFRGQTLNNRTINMLLNAERILGAAFHITQGSYSTRVAASGGTHSGGGAMDTNGPRGWGAAVSALRQAGFAAWHRTPSQGPWNHHIHSIAMGDTSASASAKAQMRSFRAGGNGLGALGYRLGTPWVPSDQLAFVHEGEGILPRKVNEARIAASRSGGGTQTVVLRVESGGSRMDDFLAEMIRRYVRVNGGDVQKVLGRG
jgi:hypothetical protein